MPKVLAPRLEFFRCPTFSFGKKRKRVPETVRVETVQSDTLERLPENLAHRIRACPMRPRDPRGGEMIVAALAHERCGK